LDKGLPYNVGMDRIRSLENAMLLLIEAIDSRLPILESIFQVDFSSLKPLLLIKAGHRTSCLIDEI
jgi:hypothetical protein